jgi:hypothetical protein
MNMGLNIVETMNNALILTFIVSSLATIQLITNDYYVIRNFLSVSTVI